MEPTKDMIDVAVEKYPRTSREQWTLTPSGAAFHRDARVCEGAAISAGVIIRRGWIGECSRILGGTFRGGEFRGGTFRGGEFWDGTFLGGEFRGGTFLGGEFWDGTFLGGEFRGGTFLGGEFRGGTFRGGTFRGGTFLGGRFLGGTFRQQPLVVLGLLPWVATVCAPSTLAIGCEVHAFSAWRERLDEIAAEHGVNDATKAKVLQVIDMAEAWHAENPIEEDEQEAEATK